MLSLPEVPEEFNICTFLLDRHLKEGRGNNIAVYYKDKKLTYAQIAEESNRFGNVLLNLGIERENRVMICLYDCPEFITSFFGAMKIGAVPVPVSTMAVSQDYLYYLNDSRAKVLIIDEKILPEVIKVKNQLIHLKHIIVLGNSEPGQLNYSELIKNSPPDLTTAITSRDDMAFWFYSSGTTGKPKGVVHLHHDLVFLTAHCREVLSMTPDDIVFSVSKLYFSYGRNSSLDSVFFSGGAAVLYPGLPRPESIVKVVKKYRPTIFCGVPSSYSAILNYLEKYKVEYDFSSVRAFVSAGEPLPKGIFYRWKEKFGMDILDGIGSTDVGAIYISSLPGQIKPGSVGKLLSNFEGKLVDELGREVARGEIGNLWIKCDGTASHYWNKHQKTKESFCGEWFITGDMFYQDEEGFYYSVGRSDDMLKAGGIWVSPFEVEDILTEHHAVSECGVVGAPDKDNLEKPVAFVVLKKGYKPSPLLENELQEFVRSKTAHYKYPRCIHFVDKLPRTANGKLQRCKLREKLYSFKNQRQKSQP
ncbi:MAG: benzoate-CoA ligase family protein [Pelotomaculum sp.]|uniref:Acyl-coenzyme A synthetases/AMP-(Fatty) acid ligases n=1 Tax=Pelotomaculum thermopropionicum (strain DSM 13744 / JCM 10971 / SI) TaxID=370438 RepID=A5D1Z4_PELTS|nr:benzoate-CoA ligase family protein [Pelotomaculum sp.]BAF59726.1 acyl-coenzyme A synthetases/AMP-(fatty) acid ligases [Pelotomaculum thermopropionicum SI]